MTKNQILIHLSESENTKFGKEEFARQSFPQKVFSAIAAPNGACGAAFVRGRYITEASRALFIGGQSAVAYTASWALSPHAPGRDSCS
jgi:hypothetical protein